jgi:hypothetical protein
MKKRLTALGLTVGLVGGGAAGLALGVPALSSAQSGGTDSATTTPPTTAAGGAGDSTATTTPAVKPDRAKWIQDALAPLVTAGTLTQAQADAVAQALQNAKPAVGPGHDGGPKGFGRGLAGGLDAAAKAIGVTTDELRQAVAGGQSIAAYAKSKNVEPQTVIDALVAEATARLAEAVTAGKLTQAQADTRLTDETTRITNLVNGTFTFPDFGGHRDRGPRGDGSTPSTTAPTTPPTTTG